MAQGNTTREAAAALFVSRKTIGSISVTPIGSSGYGRAPNWCVELTA